MMRAFAHRALDWALDLALWYLRLTWIVCGVGVVLVVAALLLSGR